MRNEHTKIEILNDAGDVSAALSLWDLIQAAEASGLINPTPPGAWFARIHAHEMVVDVEPPGVD